MRKKSFVIAYFLFSSLGMILSSCSEEYNDEEIWNKVNELVDRVQALENTCSQLNSNIISVQTLLEASMKNYTITSIQELEEGEGYIIKLTNGESITIFNGHDGVDGKDGYTPSIGIKQDTDGFYYWTLDGDWLLDDAENKIKAVGQDGQNGEDGQNGKDGENGKDGQNGKDGENGKDGQNGANGKDGKNGKDGISPQLKIENDYWFVSYDNGNSWTKLGKATGKDGENGKDGKDGVDGENAIGCLFSNIDTSKTTEVIFTLIDGTVITIPRTDKELAMLIGEWIRAGEDDKLIFNTDGTFQFNTLKGTFEYITDRHIIIVFASNYDGAFTLLKITNESLMLCMDERIGDTDMGSGNIRLFYKKDAITLEKTMLNVPKEGGTYTITINSNLSLKAKVSSSSSIDSSISTSNLMLYQQEKNEMDYTFDFKNNLLTVTIQPAGYFPTTQKIDICDEIDNVLATITIEQEGDSSKSEPPITFTEEGKHLLAELKTYFAKAMRNSHQMDAEYTEQITASDFNKPINAWNMKLESYWTSLYKVIHTSNVLIQADTNEKLKHILTTINAYCYYQLAVFWEKVPYIPTNNTDSYIYPQIPLSELFSKLTEDLKSATEKIESNKDELSDIIDFIPLSKNIPYGLLSKIYMYQGNYTEALSVLNKMNLDGYQLETTIAGNELIWNIEGENSVPILTYTDILLSFAECNIKDENISKGYINQILEKKKITFTSTNLKNNLKETYKQSLFKKGGYFALLKRLGIAMTELNLDNEYQLLLPFPITELSTNPNMIQNPGY